MKEEPQRRKTDTAEKTNQRRDKKKYDGCKIKIEQVNVRATGRKVTVVTMILLLMFQPLAYLYVCISCSALYVNLCITQKNIKMVPQYGVYGDALLNIFDS